MPTPPLYVFLLRVADNAKPHQTKTGHPALCKFCFGLTKAKMSTRRYICYPRPEQERGKRAGKGGVGRTCRLGATR